MNPPDLEKQPVEPPDENGVSHDAASSSMEKQSIPGGENLKRNLQSRHIQMIAIGQNQGLSSRTLF